MEKQQKILEMAKDICRVKLNCNDVCNPISACDALKYAERAVEAGYSKPEWISVEERLPDLEPSLIRWGNYGYKKNSVRVLCVCKQKSGKILVKEGYYEVWVNSPAEPFWRIPGSIDSVTHWMPLPEAPKMKGGAE